MSLITIEKPSKAFEGSAFIRFISENKATIAAVFQDVCAFIAIVSFLTTALIWLHHAAALRAASL